MKNKIYISKIKEEKSGKERFENLKIYDVSICVFKKECYTISTRYEKEFTILMEIFDSSSRKEIKEKIGNSTLLKEVYEMQDKLSREDFVLERFPDDVFHEMERRELMETALKDGLQEGLEKGLEQGIKQGIEQGIKQGIEQGIQRGIEQGIEQGQIEMIKIMLKKGMSAKEIANLLNYDIEEILKIEK